MGPGLPAVFPTPRRCLMTPQTVVSAAELRFSASPLSATPRWETPLPLDEIPRLCWPQGVFTGVLRDLVAEVARFTQTPLDFAGMLTLTALSVGWAGKVCIEIYPG